MQDSIKIDGNVIKQPDAGYLDWSFETTYTSGSSRTQAGNGVFTEMFTTQSFGYKASDISISEVAQILQLVVGRKFTLHAFNPYSGTWEDVKCYVGQGAMSIGSLQENGEYFDELSFNMVGVNALA